MDNITDSNLFIHQAINKVGGKKALGEALGVHRHTITKWLADTGSMSLRYFMAITRVVGVVTSIRSARNL